jgi:SAM-dependent methyltransferase
MQTRETQGKLWSAAPADWVNYLEPTFIPMYESVLKKIELDEDMMLLDAGCGSGLFLNIAAGTGVTIHGFDAAPGLLEVAKKRLPGTTLMIEDLEAIPFNDETFDVVTGFNSFQYAGSFENAIKEAKRVTKKEGRVVIGIWGKEEDCDAASVFKKVSALMPPPPPGTPGPFALSEEGRVERICKSVGLKVVYKETVSCPWQFSGNEELLRGFMCTAPCVKAAQHVGAAKVSEAVLAGSQPFNLADEIYYMHNYFTFFIAEKADQ